jgi:hypothetical protein
VRFRRADEVEVSGTVSRKQGSTYVLILEGDGPPYAAILEEQALSDATLRGALPFKAVIRSAYRLLSRQVS